MGELDPTQSASDAQAIAEFCQYELVTLTQVDAHRVKATFQDSSGNVESMMGSSMVSVLLAVARRQKTHAYLRGARAAEQQLIDALQTLPVPLTTTKRREQAYTWEALTRMHHSLCTARMETHLLTIISEPSTPSRRIAGCLTGWIEALMENAPQTFRGSRLRSG